MSCANKTIEALKSIIIEVNVCDCGDIKTQLPSSQRSYTVCVYCTELAASFPKIKKKPHENNAAKDTWHMHLRSVCARVCVW